MSDMIDVERHYNAILRRGIAVALVIVASILQLNLTAGDWPHWRGPGRNDIVSESSGWDGKEWLPDRATWTMAVGIGSSSPIVVADRLFVTGWSSGQEVVRCLNATTGAELWRQTTRCPQYGRHSIGDKSIYAGPSSTPEFDSATGFLFTLSIDGDLICRDTKAKGKRVWGFNLHDRFGVKQRPNVGRSRRMHRDYGYTSSPLVVGKTLIVEVGAKAGTLIAFDTRTGKQRWASQCKDEAGHTGGAIPITVDNIPCVAILTLRNLVVVRIDKDHEGETIATYPWTTDYANNISTPAVSGNSVIVTSAYNHYAMCRLDITLKGATKVWQTDSPSGVCSPIVHNGNVYWAWRGVHCVDFATGKERWMGGKVGSQGSCILTSDDRLIIWANRGDIMLAETAKRSPTKYRELARKSGIFRADAWPHVALSNSRLYVKDRRGNLACYRLK